jgi:hypothetical protein
MYFASGIFILSGFACLTAIVLWKRTNGSLVLSIAGIAVVGYTLGLSSSLKFPLDLLPFMGLGALLFAYDRWVNPRGGKPEAKPDGKPDAKPDKNFERLVALITSENARESYLLRQRAISEGYLLADERWGEAGSPSYESRMREFLDKERAFKAVQKKEQDEHYNKYGKPLLSDAVRLAQYARQNNQTIEEAEAFLLGLSPHHRLAKLLIVGATPKSGEKREERLPASLCTPRVLLLALSLSAQAHQGLEVVLPALEVNLPRFSDSPGDGPSIARFVDKPLQNSDQILDSLNFRL